MVLLGGKPDGRFTEQHDIFFGIAKSLGQLVPQMKAFWPGVKLHVDSWREVTAVDDFRITVVAKQAIENQQQLFFFNLGGYKVNDLEEYHYKVLTVSENLADATKKAKATSFYRHVGYKGANSHIDDKYGIDVDDVFKISDILSASLRTRFELKIEQSETPLEEDELHIGYVMIDKLVK